MAAGAAAGVAAVYSDARAPYETYEAIRVAIDGAICTVTFCRPDVKNAMSMRAYLETVQVLSAAAADPAVLVVILTGAGDYFTSGADLSEPGALGPNMINPVLAPVGRFMLALLRFPKVLVAAVNGPAVGIGVTLLPHCDVAYASTAASFWVPFARIAVVPEFCSSVTLPQILGPSLANEMLLMSRKLGAEEAAARGLVSGPLFPTDRLLPEVRKRVNEMLAQPLAKDSLPLYKRMIKRPVLAHLESVFHEEMAELGRRAVNGDTARAVQALNQARRPAKPGTAESKL